MSDYEDYNHSKVNRLLILMSVKYVTKLWLSQNWNQENVCRSWNIGLRNTHRWGIASDLISAMCFDTTSVNTGSRDGVCVLIEAALKKHLLNLACRYHMMELVLEKVFCPSPQSLT